MNAICSKRLFNLQIFIRKDLTSCLTWSRFQKYSHKGNPNVKYYDPAVPLSTRNFKYNNENQRINGVNTGGRNSEFGSFLSSNEHDPDSFGTLSEDWKTQEQLKTLPEEEDDTIVIESKKRLTINQYGRIIKKFLEERKVAQAIEVLETRMKDDRVKPDSYIYNLLIGACGKVGYTRKAFNLHKQMRTRGLKVTGHTYTGIFNACANSPYPEEALVRAHHLRATLVERAFLMNQTLYHAMIKAFGRCGDMETAFLLVDEMLDKKIKVSDESFNFLLQACIADKAAGFRQALLVWRKMLEKRVKPSLYSFNLLLRCSRDCGMGDKVMAAQCLQVLLQDGQQSSNMSKLIGPAGHGEGHALATLGQAAVDHGQNMPNLISPKPTMGDVMIVNNITLPEHRLMLMGGSSGVLDLMDKFRVEPDIKTFTQLLDQIPSTLAAENELLDRLKKAKVPLDSDFCNMLIRKRALRGDYENAKRTLRLIQEENLKPNMMTFGVLAIACQDRASARQLLEDIDKLGFVPNIEILGTLVKNACYSRDCDFIIEVMKKVEEGNLKPNDQFLKHLDNFYRFASSVLRKHLTDNTGVLNCEKFDEFRELYRVWQRDMRPDDPLHPWEQFCNKDFDPEDQELISHGKIVYSKKS